MVISVDVDVNEIAHLGRDFPWRKPSSCPKCNVALWWHGFVLAYFDHLSQAVFLRRLRCPCCGAVHRLRPKAYWSRFRSSIQIIKQVIINRTFNRCWRPDLPRSRQRLWWQRFCAQVKIVLGLTAAPDLQAFNFLFVSGRVPVSDSFNMHL